MMAATDDTESSKPARKLHRSTNQLKRYAACIPCRRRRIKCDAVKPHCASCVRSFDFLKRTQPEKERDDQGVQCWYDGDDDGHDEPTAEKRKGEDDPREEVKRLEERVGECYDQGVSLGIHAKRQISSNVCLSATAPVEASPPRQPRRQHSIHSGSPLRILPSAPSDPQASMRPIH